jgi:hypothetical protein
MQYLLMIYTSEATKKAIPPAEMGTILQAYSAYTDAMNQAGVLRAGERLHPTANATSVRVRNGKSEVLNGPFADTQEQLGGYYVIDVPDLDAALQWAARCPSSAFGTIEVRPIWTM